MRRVIGVTELPGDLPKGSFVAQRTCGCYLIMQPGEPVSEFVCEHGYFVSVHAIV